MKRSLKRDIVRWKCDCLSLPSVFLSTATVCSCSLFHFLPPYLSFSAYSRPLESKWFQLWEEMNGWYLFLFPCSATAVSMPYVTGREGQAEALQFLCPGDLSLQSMKHARQRRERKYRGTDREVWYSETKASSESRKKMWDRWSQETDRQGKKKMGSSVTWRKRGE